MRSYTTEEIEKLFQPITSRYGIKIVYKLDSKFAPIRIGGSRKQFSKLEPIDKSLLIRCRVLLEKALNKYPVPMIRTYLKAVYFAKKIERDGFPFAGTYDPFRKIVYLVDNDQLQDDIVIATFHHEFSSILLNSKGFFLNPWLEQNPKDFKYRNELYEDKEKEYEDSDLTGTMDEYEKGLLNKYGQTNFENDFNEYAAMIFTNPQKFKKIINQYPRVRAKFLLFLEFYHKIDPIFTEEYLLGSD